MAKNKELFIKFPHRVDSNIITDYEALSTWCCEVLVTHCVRKGLKNYQVLISVDLYKSCEIIGKIILQSEMTVEIGNKEIQMSL